MKPEADAYPPVAEKKDLERRAALPPELLVTPELWTQVHDEVQRQLAFLESEVRRQVPAVRVEAGRTRGDQFFLFTYQTFSVPDCTLDPVVAGMTFTPAFDKVAVEADVSGEQTGDVISSLPIRTVAHSRAELLEAARDLARRLGQSAEVIAAALEDSSRKVE